MKTMKRTTAFFLALVLAISCFSAIALAAPTIKSIRIIQNPTKLTYYKDTDWDYGYWKFPEDGPGKGVFTPRANMISFMHNGGYYSELSDIGMVDLNGMVVEVTYSDGSKKKVEYKETISNNKVTQNIMFSPQSSLKIGQNVIEIYFKENYDVYTTFTITITDSASIKGDINGDKMVNSADALQVLRHVVGSTLLTGDKLAAADVNKDKIVNSLDALEILKIAVGQ